MINDLINLNDYYIENIGKNVDYSRPNLKEWIKENKLEFFRLIYDSIFAGIKRKNNNPDFSESLIQDTRFAAVEFDGANMTEQEF